MKILLEAKANLTSEQIYLVEAMTDVEKTQWLNRLEEEFEREINKFFRETEVKANTLEVKQ